MIPVSCTPTVYCRSTERIIILYASHCYHVGGAEVVVANLCRQINSALFVSLCHHPKERGSNLSHSVGRYSESQ